MSLDHDLRAQNPLNWLLHDAMMAADRIFQALLDQEYGSTQVPCGTPLTTSGKTSTSQRISLWHSVTHGSFTIEAGRIAGCCDARHGKPRTHRLDSHTSTQHVLTKGQTHHENRLQG